MVHTTLAHHHILQDVEDCSLLLLGGSVARCFPLTSSGLFMFALAPTREGESGMVTLLCPFQIRVPRDLLAAEQDS